MTSQPNNLTKISGSRPIQILPKSGTNMSLNRTVPIQILNHNQTLNLPMRTSGGAIVSDLNSSLPLQMSKPTITMPLHLTSSDTMNVPKSSTVTNNSFPGSLLTAQLTNLRAQNHTVNTIQLIPNQQNLVKQQNSFGDETDKHSQNPMKNSIINNMLQKQDQCNNSSLQSKVQEMTPLGQLPLSGGQFQVPKSSSGTSVLQMTQPNKPLQVRVADRSFPPVLFVQTPGLKPTTDNTITTPSSSRQIILRRQVCS